MTPVETPKRTSKPYDVIKQFVEIILPASAVAYAGIASIWDLPNPEKVLATIAVAATFLGVCLKISRKQYYGNELNFDGTVIVNEHPDSGPTLTIPAEAQEALSTAVETGKKTVEFKVVTAPPVAG